jgi:SAM-dependent methyltransferase
MNQEACPLCGACRNQDSWLDLEFRETAFKYRECLECGSLFCSPMPDIEMLGHMYDSGYGGEAGSYGEDTSLEKFAQVLSFVGTQEKGVFVDYGCGDGKLLVKLNELGWNVLGIDFNPEYASGVRERGIEVIGHEQTTDVKADVLHLGDVLEHLTDLDRDVPKILQLLKNGGYLIAHGPLEGNRNLFYRALKLGKQTKKRPTQMPPFHVTLATTRGQKELFRRNGLDEVVFDEKEIAFPAPYSLSRSDLRSVRTTGLYVLRKISQTATRLGLGSGNRYFFVGRKRPVVK